MNTIIQENITTRTAAPALIATNEPDVFDANFTDMGVADIAAVVFCGSEVGGMKTIVNDQLSPAAHWDAVNIVLERLFASPSPRRFAVIKTSDLPGGAA